MKENLLELNIKICGLFWHLVVMDKDDPRLMLDNEKCKGLCLLEQRQIFLSNIDSGFGFDRLLIHELTHAMLYSCLHDETNRFTEEQVCEILARRGREIINVADEVFNKWFNKIKKEC